MSKVDDKTLQQRDQRKFFRLEINLRTSIGDEIREIDGYTRDIGVGGVGVYVPNLVEKGMVYSVTIFFTRRDFLETDAQVVGCRYDEEVKMWRANMQFQNMVPQDRQLLTQKLFKLEVSGKGHVAK